MSQQLNDLIIRLETRTRQLLLRHAQLQQKCEQLQLCINERDERIRQLEAQNNELQSQYANLKMAKYIDMADNDVKDMRSRIRKMVRDIDQCISMLKLEKEDE